MLLFNSVQVLNYVPLYDTYLKKKIGHNLVNLVIRCIPFNYKKFLLANIKDCNFFFVER